MSTPADVVLPCGCVLRCVEDRDRREFQIIQCRRDCPNAGNAIALATEQGKAVEYRDDLP